MNITALLSKLSFDPDYIGHLFAAARKERYFHSNTAFLAGVSVPRHRKTAICRARCGDYSPNRFIHR